MIRLSDGFFGGMFGKQGGRAAAVARKGVAYESRVLLQVQRRQRTTLPSSLVIGSSCQLRHHGTVEIENRWQAGASIASTLSGQDGTHKRNKPLSPES